MVCTTSKGVNVPLWQEENRDGGRKRCAREERELRRAVPKAGQADRGLILPLTRLAIEVAKTPASTGLETWV